MLFGTQPWLASGQRSTNCWLESRVESRDRLAGWTDVGICRTKNRTWPTLAALTLHPALYAPTHIREYEHDFQYAFCFLDFER